MPCRVVAVVAASVSASAASDAKCCESCVAPLEKYYSVDVAHGFCGEACMDPKKFNTYKIFEKNLTKADTNAPCAAQFTPTGTHYTVYNDTVTHGVPGILAVTLDLYAPGPTLGAPRAMACPTTPASTACGMRVTATAAATCDQVSEEMVARVAGQPVAWHDPHNNGTYTKQAYGGTLSYSRLTGDGKYTDKMIFTLTPDGSSCTIEACSRSQVFSIGDFGTNYCEIRMLYCGSKDGCKPVKNDFTSSGETTQKFAQASVDTSLATCLKV